MSLAQSRALGWGAIGVTSLAIFAYILRSSVADGHRAKQIHKGYRGAPLDSQEKIEQANGNQNVIQGVDKQKPGAQKEGPRNASGAAWSNK